MGEWTLGEVVRGYVDAFVSWHSGVRVCGELGLPVVLGFRFWGILV